VEFHCPPCAIDLIDLTTNVLIYLVFSPTLLHHELVKCGDGVMLQLLQALTHLFLEEIRKLLLLFQVSLPPQVFEILCIDAEFTWFR
jgi:hypothetical protein